jgi:hypothetical protein
MHFHTEPNPPLPNCEILWKIVSGFFPCKFQLRSPRGEEGKGKERKGNANERQQRILSRATSLVTLNGELILASGFEESFPTLFC